MVNYREILRLHSLGTSQRSIAQQVQSSRDTVADIDAGNSPYSNPWYIADEPEQSCRSLKPDVMFSSLWKNLIKALA